MNQVFRSGTAIGANIREAQGAESKNDFKHKMKIAYKETEETEFWLCLQQHAYPSEEIDYLLGVSKRIKQMLGRILTTCARSK